jgi:hypothetical protein
MFLETLRFWETTYKLGVLELSSGVIYDNVKHLCSSFRYSEGDPGHQQLLHK